jgi:hypothetical protein
MKVKLVLPVFTILTMILTGACGTNENASPTPDLNAVYTQAAELVATQFAMQQTQTAMAVTPTVQATTTLPPAQGTTTFSAIGTPFGVTPGFTTPGFTTPGFTPIASVVVPTNPPAGGGSTANGCNDSQFVSETIPDKSVFSPGEEFTKVWEMLNTGTCAWETGYVFAFMPADSTTGFSGYDIVYKASDAATQPQYGQSFNLKLKAPDTPGEYFGYWKMKDASGNFFGARVYVNIIVE